MNHFTYNFHLTFSFSLSLSFPFFCVSRFKRAQKKNTVKYDFFTLLTCALVTLGVSVYFFFSVTFTVVSLCAKFALQTDLAEGDEDDIKFNTVDITWL